MLALRDERNAGIAGRMVAGFYSGRCVERKWKARETEVGDYLRACSPPRCAGTFDYCGQRRVTLSDEAGHRDAAATGRLTAGGGKTERKRDLGGSPLEKEGYCTKISKFTSSSRPSTRCDKRRRYATLSWPSSVPITEPRSRPNTAPSATPQTKLSSSASFIPSTVPSPWRQLTVAAIRLCVSLGFAGGPLSPSQVYCTRKIVVACDHRRSRW